MARTGVGPLRSDFFHWVEFVYVKPVIWLWPRAGMPAACCAIYQCRRRLRPYSAMSKIYRWPDMPRAALAINRLANSLSQARRPTPRDYFMVIIVIL